MRKIIIISKVVKLLTYNTDSCRQCIKKKHPSGEWFTNCSSNLNCLESLETANYTRNWNEQTKYQKFRTNRNRRGKMVRM